MNSRITGRRLMCSWQFLGCMVCLFLFPNVAASTERGAPSKALVLKKAQTQLEMLYELKYYYNRDPADWLPDGSGYTMMETIPDTDRRERVRYDVESGERTVIEVKEDDDSGRSETLSPDGDRVFYVEEGNLFVRNLSDDQSIQFTHDAPGGAISNNRAAWSPDGKRIVFVQRDVSRVKKRNVLVPTDPSYPEVREDLFARVGETIASLRVGVVDVESKALRWLAISQSAEGFYLGQVSWAGNSDDVLIEKLSRFRNKRAFLLADVNTGGVSTIFKESDPAWVVASYGKNSGLEWLHDGKAFLVLSEKDGWRRAYVYSRAGKELMCLTPDAVDIIERAKVDEARGWFYYYASPNNGTQKYLFRVKLDGTGKPERVTPDQPGTHDYEFSPDARWAFHTYSRFDTPPITQLIELPAHRTVRVLEDNRALRKKWADLDMPPVEFFQVEIEGNVTMDAWMLKPSNFDPARKYPVLVYVYGEPHAQTVQDQWLHVHSAYHRMIAELGYLVVSIDNRGTPAPKGAAWRRSVFGSLGPLSTEEQAAAIQAVGRERSYVDMSRIGIWGWSGGGSNTLNAMFRKPDVYKVGIAVVPKPQAHLYNAWFQEIYMETRETNPDGYEQSSALNFAEGLKGDLLIIHGTGETNTHLQIVEGLIDRLIELGKAFDYMAYPNRNHGLFEGEGTVMHVRMLMARYLLDHLPPGPK